MSGYALAVPDVTGLDTLAATLAYAKAGWYQAPVESGKHPGSVLGKKWQDHTSRDPEQLIAWHAGRSLGIALHNGRSGAVSFDVDHPENIPPILAQAIGDLKPPFQSSRPDQPGRGHAVFLQPPGRDIGNSTGELGKGWGEVRGRNGVIIAEPTPHVHGGLYHWQRTGLVPVLPDEIAALLPDGSADLGQATDAEVAAFTAAHAARNRMQALNGVLTSWLTKTSAGESRHVTALGCTVWAAKEAAAGLYPASLAFDTIGDLFRQSLNDDPDRKWKDEYASIVAWAVRQAKAADLEQVQAIVERADTHNLQIHVDTPATDASGGRHRETSTTGAQAGSMLDDKGRLCVEAGDVNPVDIAEAVAEHIVAQNDPPHLFSISADTAAVLAGGKLMPLDKDDRWLYYVATRTTFVSGKGAAKQRIVAPPAAVMKLIPSVVIPQLPPLDGIATTPYLDVDGNVIADDGYNPATRLVLHTGGFILPPVPEIPSDEDVAQAVKLLTEDWLGDFPFATPADKANALAVPLTLTGRMFFALAPLFVIDASTAGSGKGLMVTTISLIASGEVVQVMELPADGEEQRKKITSALLAGNELIMWDESHVIAGRTLAAILTAETYSDRLLGGNKMIAVRNRFTQVALGNNVEVWGDMKRRVVPSRLVPDTDHPEHRSDFRHPDLDGWVREHRGELLAAVLTIWRNWIARGRPGAQTGMGSFDRWARAVGGALQAAGVEGFRSNTTEWLSDSDDDDGWGEHLTELRGRFGDGWFTVGEVAEAIETVIAPLKRPPLKTDPGKTLSQQLPYAYRKIRERWHGDLRLVRSSSRESASGGRKWSVQERADPLRSGTPEPSSASSVSSADQAEPQVTAPQGFQQPALTMLSCGASSVDAQNDETAGQNRWPDDTDDTDHPNAVPERRSSGGWPAGSIGEEANQ